MSCLFFFSSRRRHTRWPRDWSSDVCSSDLNLARNGYSTISSVTVGDISTGDCFFNTGNASEKNRSAVAVVIGNSRSEERRVGKECECGSSQKHSNEKGSV